MSALSGFCEDTMRYLMQGPQAEIIHRLRIGSTEGIDRYVKQIDAIDSWCASRKERDPLPFACSMMPLLEEERVEDNPFLDFVWRMQSVMFNVLTHDHYRFSKCEENCSVLKKLEEFKSEDPIAYQSLCEKIWQVVKSRLPANAPYSVGELILKGQFPQLPLSFEDGWETIPYILKDRFILIHKQLVFKKLEKILSQIVSENCSSDSYSVKRSLKVLKEQYPSIFNDLSQSMYETVQIHLPSSFPFEVGELILVGTYPFYTATQNDFEMATTKTFSKLKDGRLSIEEAYLVDRTLEIDAVAHSFITADDPSEIRELMGRFLEKVKIGHPESFSYREFVKEVVLSLKQLASIPTGYRLLNEITHATSPITIQRGGRNFKTSNKDATTTLVMLEFPPEQKNAIFQRPTGENYISSNDFITTLAHELIHVYHSIKDSKERSLSITFTEKENLCFENEEEMITILGHNMSRSSPLTDPISENTIQHELGLDKRVSHYSCSDTLESTAYRGVDENFHKLLSSLQDAGGLEESKRERCLGYAMLGANTICTQYGIEYHLDEKVQALENHFRIIEQLLKKNPDGSGVDYADLLHLQYYPILSVILLYRFGEPFPLHNALTHRGLDKKMLIRWLNGEFRLRGGGRKACSDLILSQNEKGLTPFEIARETPDTPVDVIEFLAGLDLRYKGSA